jgi:integrase
VQAILDALVSADDRGAEVTDLHLRRLKKGERLFDPKRRGLIARMGADGKAVWMYRYRALDGSPKQTELRFGSWPEMGLADARKTWAALRAQRLAGQIPVLPQAMGAEITVGDLCDLYLRDYAARAKRASSVREDARLIERHLRPTYGATAVSVFETEQAEAVLRPLKDRGAMREAEKVKAVCSTIWNVGTRGSRKVDLGAVRWLPAGTTNPWTVVSTPKGKRKTDTIPRTTAELRAYVRGVLALGDEGDVLWLQALTGVRINEATGACLSEIDPETKVWTIPAERMKAGEPHRVMLSPAAWAIVERRLAAGQELLFPGPRTPGKPMSTNYAQDMNRRCATPPGARAAADPWPAPRAWYVDRRARRHQGRP